ncbi:MAG: tRNA epoxyqueuosine(34) reductase QueG, partial [Ferruginibacter sp.]
PTNEINFAPLTEVLNFSTSDWEELTEESFKKIFKDSPIKRTKYKGVRRNLKFLQSNDERD